MATYKEIDKTRLKYLLSWGTKPGELTQFFQNSRAALIRAGAKAQNTPEGREAQATFLTRLPEKAYSIFESFLSKKIPPSTDFSVDQLIQRFRAAETDPTGEGLTDEEARLMSRAALSFVLRDDCPEALLAFLREPITPKSKSVKEFAQSEVQQIRGSVEFGTLRAIVTSLLNDGVEVPRGMSDQARAFISGLLNVRAKKFDSASNDLSILEIDGEFAALLQEVIKTAKEAQLQRKASGLIEEPVEQLDSKDNVDIDEIEVLGYCYSSAPTKPSFIDILAVISSGKFYSASDAVLKDIFPSKGQLIAFPNTIGVHLPQKGEIGVWRAEEYPTDQPIKCRVRGSARLVFEVHRIPCRPDQYDLVRSAIREFKPVGLTRPLFELENEIVVRPKGDGRDLSKETFDTPLDAWRALSYFEWRGRKFVLGPLPSPSLVYDCADVDTLARRLFRAQHHLEQSGTRVTRAQVTELVDSLRSMRTEIDVSRLDRLKEELERVFTAKEKVAAAFQAILDHPTIREELEKAKNAAIQQQLAERKDLTDQIARLTTQKTTIEKELRNYESEQIKLPTQIGGAIRSAFESAQTEGLQTLSKSFVFKSLIELLDSISANQPGKSREVEAPKQASSFAWTIESPTDLDPIEIFRAVGLPKGLSARLIEAINVATYCGLGIALSGIAASAVARKYARAISKRSVLTTDIPLGLMHDITSNHIHAAGSEWDVLLINLCNHSPIEVYAPAVLETLTDRIADTSQTNHTTLMFTFSDSIAALPKSKSLLRRALHINSEKGTYEELDGDLRQFTEAIVAQSDNQPWRQTIARVTERLNALDLDARRKLLPIFKVGLIDSLAD